MGHEGPAAKCRYSSILSLTSALDGGWLLPRLVRSTPGNDWVLIVWEVGWAPGPVWTGAGCVASTGIRSWNRPACSESPYRLSCLSPLKLYAVGCNLECSCSETMLATFGYIQNRPVCTV